VLALLRQPPVNDEVTQERLRARRFQRDRNIAVEKRKSPEQLDVQRDCCHGCKRYDGRRIGATSLARRRSARGNETASW
jgi:hypothetical protein